MGEFVMMASNKESVANVGRFTVTVCLLATLLAAAHSGAAPARIVTSPARTPVASRVLHRMIADRLGVGRTFRPVPPSWTRIAYHYRIRQQQDGTHGRREGGDGDPPQTHDFPARAESGTAQRAPAARPASGHRERTQPAHTDEERAQPADADEQRTQPARPVSDHRERAQPAHTDEEQVQASREESDRKGQAEPAEMDQERVKAPQGAIDRRKWTQANHMGAERTQAARTDLNPQKGTPAVWTESGATERAQAIQINYNHAKTESASYVVPIQWNAFIRTRSGAEGVAEATYEHGKARNISAVYGRRRPKSLISTMRKEAATQSRKASGAGSAQTSWSFSRSTVITSTASVTSSSTAISPTKGTAKPPSATLLREQTYPKHPSSASGAFSDEAHQVDSVADNKIDFKQEASGSDKVLAYQLRAANLGATMRQAPQFFVPPIVRRSYRRRVLLEGRSARRRPSLGHRLAEQIRRQLAELQRRESVTLGLPGLRLASPQPSTAPPAPLQRPVIANSATSSPPPCHRHHFSPESSDTAPTQSLAPPSTSVPQSLAPPSAPQTLRVPARRQRPASPPGSRQPQHATPAANIVHEETLEAGFIVGEYGEMMGGGTVRGVKYAADSSVDRRLLDAALAQFLRL